MIITILTFKLGAKLDDVPSCFTILTLGAQKSGAHDFPIGTRHITHPMGSVNGFVLSSVFAYFAKHFRLRFTSFRFTSFKIYFV